MKKWSLIVVWMIFVAFVSSCHNQENAIEDSNGDTMDESSELPMSTDGESTEDGEVATDMGSKPIVHTAHEKWELMTRFPDKQEAGGYKYIERELYISDFADIKVDVDAYADVVELLGEPNGFAGPETKWPYYQLIDGTNVVLQIHRDEDGNFTDLFNIVIVDRGGRRFTH
jgi:hypothetical protein